MQCILLFMCVLFLSATLHVHFIHGQLLVHLYVLLSCHAASVKCFYKSCFLWQINDDDDDECVRRTCIQWGSVPSRSHIKGMELPAANILIPLERQSIALQLCC